jgi:hypothetical protein
MEARLERMKNLYVKNGGKLSHLGRVGTPLYISRLAEAVRRFKMPNSPKYLVGTVPGELPPGEVLVHNHVRARRTLGLNGFRAWTEKPSNRLEVCNCKWAGVDLHGLKHYRVKRAADADENGLPV